MSFKLKRWVSGEDVKQLHEDFFEGKMSLDELNHRTNKSSGSVWSGIILHDVSTSIDLKFGRKSSESVLEFVDNPSR